MKRSSTVLTSVSGKGGVGKSIIAVNLAEMLSEEGHRVALIDADFGQGACKILLNETPSASLYDTLRHVRAKGDVPHRTSSGITLVEVVHEAGQADGHEKALFALLDRTLEDLRREHEYVIIDAPAGVEGPVRWALDRADLGLLVLVGEPTAIADAYRLVKLIWQADPNYPLATVVNFADSLEDALSVSDRFGKVTERFMGNVPNFLGWVPFSAAVRQSVVEQVPAIRRSATIRNAFEQITQTLSIGRNTDVTMLAT